MVGASNSWPVSGDVITIEGAAKVVDNTIDGVVLVLCGH